MFSQLELSVCQLNRRPALEFSPRSLSLSFSFPSSPIADICHAAANDISYIVRVSPSGLANSVELPPEQTRGWLHGRNIRNRICYC